MSPTAPPGGRISLHFSSYAYKSLNTRERQLGTTSEPLFFFSSSSSFFPRLIVSLASDRTALDFTSQEAPRSCGEQAAVTAHPPVSTPCLCVHYCTCVCVCARFRNTHMSPTSRRDLCRDRSSDAIHFTGWIKG